MSDRQTRNVSDRATNDRVKVLEAQLREAVQSNSLLQAIVELLQKAQESSKKLHTQPEMSADITKVVLVMLHETGLANQQIWREYEELLSAQGIQLVFHLAKGELPPEQVLPEWVMDKGLLLSNRYEAKWGDITLYEAMVLAAADTVCVACPSAKYVMLASGTHLPICKNPFSRPMEDMADGEVVSWIPDMVEVPQAAKQLAENAMGHLEPMQIIFDNKVKSSNVAC